MRAVTAADAVGVRSAFQLLLQQVNRGGYSTTKSIVQKRFWSSDSNNDNTKTESSHANPLFRYRRLAGRRRFYRNVDVGLLTSSPWEHKIQPMKIPDPQQEINLLQNLKHNLTPRTPIISAGTKQHEKKPAEQHKQQDNLSWYGVTLDGQWIQTPSGQTLAVPSGLWAGQIAAEWDSVETLLNPTQMPAMTLTCTVLDQTAWNPDLSRAQILNFIPTDTVCYFADNTEEERALLKKQQQAWRKIHSRVQHVTGVSPATVVGTMQGIKHMKSSSLQQRRGLDHNPVLVEYASDFCHSLDAWHLAAFQTLTAEAKSFWLPWVVLTQQYLHRQDQKASFYPLVFSELDDAVHAARVEEEFQISNWGLVEGQHDYDRLNASVSFSAALSLVHCLAQDCNLRWTPLEDIK